MASMRKPAIKFTHTGLTVHAAPRSDHWEGELLNQAGEVQDVFAYTRDAFPGAVIGAFRVSDVAFAPRLAARLWLYTMEGTDPEASSPPSAAQLPFTS